MSESPMIYKLLPKIAEEIGALGKDKRNEHFKFQYRSFEQVIGALHPIFVKHGVTPCPMVKDGTMRVDGELKNWLTTAVVVYRMYAPDGSYVDCECLAQGNDPGDKGAYKLMSGAIKYAFGQMFTIPFDAEEADAEPATSVGYNSANRQPERAPERAPAQTTFYGFADKPKGAVFARWNNKKQEFALVGSLSLTELIAAEKVVAESVDYWLDKGDEKKQGYAEKDLETIRTEKVKRTMSRGAPAKQDEYATGFPADGDEPPF